MTKESFVIHGLDESGLTFVGDPGGDGFFAISAKPITLGYGEELTVTPSLIDANRDRNGETILEMSEAEQIEKFGRARFGRGPVPEEVLATVAAQRRAEAIRERDSLIRQNPAIRRQTAAEQRIASLNALIDGGE